MIVAAADIGGTHSRWGLVETWPKEGYRLLYEISFSNEQFNSFYDQLARFIDLSPCTSRNIDRLTLALAGPIDSCEVRLTNIDWTISRQYIAEQFGISNVRLLNDLVAAAIGTAWLQKSDLMHLFGGKAEDQGCRLIIGAGTGLGLAYLHHIADAQHAFATEGGHIRFAPASHEQHRLLQFLQEKYGRISYERIVSGQGLSDLYSFVAEPAPAEVTAAWVCQQADAGDPAALHAVQLWSEVYGSFVGNIALLFRPLGGIYLVGGMSTRLSHWIKSTTFYNALMDQGRMQTRVAGLPLFLVTHQLVGLEGAIRSSIMDESHHKEVLQ